MLSGDVAFPYSTPSGIFDGQFGTRHALDNLAEDVRDRCISVASARDSGHTDRHCTMAKETQRKAGIWMDDRDAQATTDPHAPTHPTQPRAHGDQGVVVHDYTDPDDAIRAIQALRGAGFTGEQINVVTNDDALRQRIEEGTHLHEQSSIIAEALHGIASLFGRLSGHGMADEHAQGYEDRVAAGHVLVTVEAGERAALAHHAMHDGLVYQGGTHGIGIAHPYLDSSVGSGAAVATAGGTGTGITPGAGYDANTGSSTQSTGGVLGQLAPGADTPDVEDDFPSDVEHDPRH